MFRAADTTNQGRDQRLGQKGGGCGKMGERGGVYYDGKKDLGISSPAYPAFIIPEPLSRTTGVRT